ncbi:MAG: MBOAT family protein [Lachnospiraceae bacterium]|nr:MBOAT family protein [Lachnospiraceae bacterium]
MLFNSFNYLIFFPLVVLFYFVIPIKYTKVRNLWLLIASYYFYMNWNAAYALLLFGSTLVTYLAGILIDKTKQMNRLVAAKWILGGSFAVNLGILFFYKYVNFFGQNINRMLGMAGSDKNIPVFDILLPVGISFYIFQALGYTMDVYRGKTAATKNLLRYMLFVSFFPQLVAGPIERSYNLLGQFDEEHRFDVDRVREGLLIMLWGLFMKIVIADNVAGYVNVVYENYVAYTGVEIILATVLFAFQIYCDFGGYSYLAIGSAKVLGFTLMENFHAPYQAISVKDFWSRWHKSLTTWFTDYLYIPLGGNRKGKIRKYINTLIVFFVSGMWHGAAWSYVLWGVLNGVYMIVEDATKSLREKIKTLCKVDESRFSYRLGCGLLTFALVDFAWLFFRAEGIGHAVAILKQMVLSLQFEQIFGLAVNRMGFSMQLLVALLVAFALLFTVDILIDKGKDVSKLVLEQGIWFRWLVYLGLLFMIMTFGAYGMDFTQTEFIYFQF